MVALYHSDSEQALQVISQLCHHVCDFKEVILSAARFPLSNGDGNGTLCIGLFVRVK